MSEGGESLVKKGKRPQEPKTSDDKEVQEDYKGLDKDLLNYKPLNEDLINPSGFKYAGAVISSKMTLREPRSYKEAMNLPDADKWYEATELEMQSIIMNHIFEVVDLPQGKRAISARWVYKRKLGPDGEILKHKARLVARGLQQREGIDFNETFSGVVKPGSYRILFALTAILGWISHQMDVKTAFLNADMQEEVYVNPPNPYALSKRQVWKMLRALYGFKQSPRAWYEKLSSKLKALGFRVSSYNQCVFIHDQQDLIITVHVDNLRIFSQSEDRITQFKKEIRKEFDMTDEAEGTLYLGMHIEQSPGQVKLHQAAYIRKILKRFNFQNITPVRTPCDPNMKLHKKTSKEATNTFKHKYLQMFGSLNYLPSISRPNLTYATGLISRYNANPNQTHIDAATRIYTYLADTINRGICYTKDAPELKGFVDSDYGGCRDTAKSTTGWVFILGGSPILWSSRR